MAETNSEAASPPPVRYDQDTCIVRLQDQLRTRSIFQLCDEIDLAINYYRYKKIRIEIDSPGGDISSLDYYVSKLQSWKSKGITVSTHALTYASSASAYIFILGDIGERYAYASSRIVLHFGRTSKNNSGLTVEELERHSSRLRELDVRYLEYVVNAIMGKILSNKIGKYPHYLSDHDQDVRDELNHIGIMETELSSKTIIKNVEKIRERIAILHEYGESISASAAEALLVVDVVERPREKFEY